MKTKTKITTPPSPPEQTQVEKTQHALAHANNEIRRHRIALDVLCCKGFKEAYDQLDGRTKVIEIWREVYTLILNADALHQQIEATKLSSTQCADLRGTFHSLLEELNNTRTYLGAKAAVLTRTATVVTDKALN